MRLSLRAFGFLAVLSVCLSIAASAEENANVQPYAKRCSPKVFRRVSGRDAPSIRVREGEKPSGFDPTITFQILENGEVAQVKIKRSSGISDLDQYALRSIRLSRYNRRPGCGTIESQATVTVDFF